MKPEDPLLILGVFGQADAALLHSWPLDPAEIAKLAPYRDQDARFVLKATQQAEILASCPTDLFVPYHQRALTLLKERLENGQAVWEPVWDEVFERLATHLYLNDTNAFQALCVAVADVPLTLPLSTQRRAFFAAGALMTADQSAAAAQQFDQLLERPDIVPYIQARTLNARAVLHRIHGQPEAALNGYRRAVSLWRSLGNRHHEAMVLTNLGIVNYELRHYAEALTQFQEAQQIFEEQQNVHWLAVVHNEMGLVDRDLGRWSSALNHFERFIEQRAAAGADHHVGLGHLNKGEVFLFQGDLTAAAAALDQAAALINSPRYQIDIEFYLGLVALAQNQPRAAEQRFRDALKLAKDTDRHEFSPHLYFHLGRLLVTTGRPQEGRQALREGIGIIEDSRRPLSEEAIKISLLGRWQQLYEALVLLEIEQGDVGAALAWSERARARAFADHLGAKNDLSDQRGDEDDWVAALDQEEMIISFFTTGVLESDLPLLRMLSADHPLRPVLLTPPHTIRFVLTSAGLSANALAFDPNLLTSSSPRGQNTGRLLAPAVLQPMQQILWDGLTVPAVGRLTIIPHGPLHSIPFAALLSENGPVVSLSPSLAIWQALNQRPPRPLVKEKGLIIAFEGREPANRLTYVNREAKQVADLTGAALWKPGSASLRESCGPASWLHFACHGWFNFEQPLASFLEIGPTTDLTAAEILNTWRINAALVVLSACQTGVSRVLRGDEPMGLVRAFLAAGAAAVVVTLWPVDDLATATLIPLFYQQLLAQSGPKEPAAALHHAQAALRSMTIAELELILEEKPAAWTERPPTDRPFADPYYWAGFVLYA